MKRDLVVAERASEITAAVECRESHRLAIICHRMHDISLYGQCSAYHAAGEAESLMHFDNRCVVAQNRWARNSRACVNVIVPIPLFRWSSWSALVAAAVVTATTGIS